MKTPPPQRAASRKKLAAAGQALADGSFPIPSLPYLVKAIRSVGRAPASKRPALKALIRKRAAELKATNAPGVKGTWAFQGSNDGGSVAVNLAFDPGEFRGKGGKWAKIGAGIEQTASKIVAGDDVGNRAGARSDRVARMLQIAAKSARDGDRDAALSMLSRARTETVGAGSQRLPPVKVRDAGSAVTSIDQHIKAVTAGPQTPRGRKTALATAANDTEAINLAATRKMPMIRGAADVQLSRTGPGMITAMHKSTGMKIGTITPKGHGYAGTHADGKATGESGGQQGALAGLIAYHNQMAAKAKAAQPMAGAKMFTAPETDAVDLAGALPTSTPAASSMDGPRVTSMGAGKPAKTAKPAGSPSGLSPYGMGIYRKFIAKKMKPAVAMAFAKRADAMHAKAAGPKASAA